MAMSVPPGTIPVWQGGAPAHAHPAARSAENMLNYLLLHGPTNSDKSPQWLEGVVRSASPLNMVVVAADVRSSTRAMDEAIDMLEFAKSLSSVCDLASTHVRGRGGWFDRFTGDGFLAYWLVDGPDYVPALDAALSFVRLYQSFFRAVVLPEVRKNTRNFPSGFGLSFGIDAGPAYLVEVARDLTILGRAVVGAVRMVGCASRPFQTIVNVFPAMQLTDATDKRPDVRWRLRPIRRSTKEFPAPDSQQVYKVVDEAS